MAEFLSHATHDPESALQLSDVAERLQANALALTELVGDVLDIARLDAVQVELQVTEFSLNAFLSEECARLMPMARAKDLTITVEVPNEPLWLRTDRVKLKRIISNLLGNAIKYTDVGEVTVSATIGEDRSVRIGIRDTGVGIARDQLASIFDEFFQLNNVERDRNKGFGLGLAVCRRLVDALGGHISVESQVGRGSLFTVGLPASCVLPSPTDMKPDEVASN